jgi:hypothetical protein
MSTLKKRREYTFVISHVSVRLFLIIEYLSLIKSAELNIV